MLDISEILARLPSMLSGEELYQKLEVLPAYEQGMRKESEPERLMRLSDLYNIYIPSRMSCEIYSKLYLALIRSLQKKGSILAVQQMHENKKAIRQIEYRGILGGSDSFTIIGTSGIGKSTAISRALMTITENRVIELDEPYQKIIPCVVVQCPYDSSVKGLLMEILRKVDELLDSTYYKNALRARATIDMLIGSVSQVSLNHIGLLVVDEIQNVVNSKNGKSLIGSLTQLINNSGISICMVGTPESIPFFEQAMQLARRSLGLSYQSMAYDEKFKAFCRIVFSYQYVKNVTQLEEGWIGWLYEHSAGVTAVVISLLHDAQEIAISTGREILNLETLSQAYEQRLSLLHPYIQPSVTHGKQTTTKIRKRKQVAEQIENVAQIESDSIAELIKKAKQEKRDVIDLLKENISITEVML